VAPAPYRASRPGDRGSRVSRERTGKRRGVMVYRILADLVVSAHLAFVLFVALGGFLVLRRRRVAWFHLPAAAWGVLIEFAGWVCPLTPLEVWLRIRGGEAGYAGGFVEHYLIPLLYPGNLTRTQQVLLGLLVLVVNVWIYLVVIRRSVRERNAREPGEPA